MHRWKSAMASWYDPFKVILGLLIILHALAVVEGSAVSLRAIYWSFPPLVVPSNNMLESQDSQSNSTAGNSSQVSTRRARSIAEAAPVGPMVEIVSDAFVSYCLPAGSKISEWSSMLSPRKVHENRAGYDILLPVTKTTTMAIMMQANPEYRFIPFIESPGVSILRDTSNGSSAIFYSILGTWPLLLALVLTAIFAGIIIWLLESRWNSDTFPKRFAKGLWEGVWWSWVTMSTVGYGDKTPMTIAGRVFAYLWILVGIIFMSIFTATVSSAISADTDSTSSITGDKVGVLNGANEEWLALSEGAEVTVYEGQRAMLTALGNGTLDAILLDSLLVISASTIMEEFGITTVGTMSAPSLHGVLLYNMSESIAQCFMRIADYYIYETFDVVKGVNRKFEKRSVEGETASLFVGDNIDWIYTMVGVVLGIILLILIGEAIYRKVIRNKVNTEENDVQKISLDNLV